jgi:hypothetical protein
MSIKARYPSISPTLNLDFANVKALDGRITFTRASSARYYDGKTVALAEQNLFNRSQEFDDAAWFKTNIAVAANTGETTAPDGTSTAEKLTSNAGSAQHYLQRSTGYVSVINGLTYAFSVFVKAGTETVVQLAAGNAPAFGTNAFVNFDLTAGTTGTVGSAASNASIVAVGNGWYRISFTCPAIANDANGNFLLGFTNNNTTAGRITTFNAAGTEDFYAWGAQLEQRDAVTAYTPTTTAPITNYVPVLLSAANNVARFDHNPVTGESLGLLIEEQRTNLKTFSEAISTANGYGANNSTLTAVTTQTPIQGLMTASKFALNTGANSGNSADGFNFGGAITLASSTAHTQSIMVKADGASVVRLRSNVTGQLFDIPIAGPAPSPSGAITGCSVQQLGNGWARVSWTFTTGASGVPATRSDYWAIKTDVADGSAGFLVVGAQLEAGAFPSSYIPTVASQVTRSADAAVMTGANFSSWYAGGQGTVYSESAVYAAAAKTQTVWDLSGGATSTSLRSPQATVARLRATVGGTFSGATTGAPIANNTFIKATVAWQGLSGRLQSDATGEDITTAANLDATQFIIGGLSVAGSTALNGHIRKIAFFPKRLANDQLQGITTV